MSAIYLEVYIQPKDDAALNKLKEFINAVESEDFEKIEAMDSEELLDEIDDIFGCVEEMRIDKGIVHLKFDIGKLSMEVEEIVDFFINLGAKDIEVAAFYSSCGEYAFYKNDSELLNEYLGTQWNWLANPLPDFTNENVILTGEFDTFSTEDFKNQIERYHGMVSSSISPKLTLVVVGKEPDQNIFDQAKALNIPLLTQSEFEEKYKL